MKILLVEDDPAELRTLRSQIPEVEFEILECADGQQAWEVYQSEPVRLLITDWKLPGMDGPELIRHVRTTPKDESERPFIMLLTSPDAADADIEGLDTHVDDYLSKPLDIRELRSRIAIALRILSLEVRLRKSLGQVQNLTTYDSLTRLLNRRSVYEYAEAEVSRIPDETNRVSLILLDIDRFREINDQYGHTVGDQVLRLVADTIEQSIRPYDWAGRWGGEEFLLVLPGTAPHEANDVAERVRANVASSSLSLTDSSVLHPRVSLGVVSTNSGTPGVDELINQANQALHRAKQEGRDRVCLFASAEA